MKFKHIDSIRGVAILMVILVHVSHAIHGKSPIVFFLASYGQMGVQLFFVVSAFTLCLSWSQRADESKPLLKYGIRRYFRIAPLYYLGILIYFLLAVYQKSPGNGVYVVPDYYSFSNVLSNVLFLHGQYPPATNSIVPGGWSIGTEMAFYALFPALFFLARKYFRKTILSAAFGILIVIIVSQVLIFAGVKLLDLHFANNTFLYYHLINQLPVFCIGIFYFLLSQEGKFNFGWKWDVVLFVFFSVVALGLWLTKIPYSFTWVPVASALSFIFLVNLFKEIDFLNFKLLQRIGTVSYSMYLLHWIFALNFSYVFLSWIPETLNANIQLVVFYVITVGFTFLLALLFERLIEKPFIRMGKTIINRIK